MRRQVRGFTLVELLVVIGVIGVLIGLIVPAVYTARKNSVKARCTNNLEQIKRFLDSYVAGSDGKMPPLNNWMDLLYPEQGASAKVFKCPGADPNVSASYSINSKLMSTSNADTYLSQVDNTPVTIFVCDGIKGSVDIDDNPTGSAQANQEHSELADARTRHLDGANYLTLGGAVRYWVPNYTDGGNPTNNVSAVGLKWNK